VTFFTTCLKLTKQSSHSFKIQAKRVAAADVAAANAQAEDALEVVYSL